MKRKQRIRRLTAVALAAAMLVTQVPVLAMAQDETLPTEVVVDFSKEDREMSPLTSFLTPPNYDIPDGRYIPLNSPTVRDHVQSQNWADTRDINLLASLPYEAHELERFIAVAERFNSIGINYYSLLAFNPSWLQNEGAGNSSMPNDLEGWKQYVKDFVQTSKDYNLNIQDWDLWNENWGINNSQYLQLIRPTWEAIKGVDPDADIGGPSPAGYDEGFMKQVIDYVGEENLSWDNLTWHEFGNDPWVMTEHVRNMRNYVNGNTPIGIKEYWSEEYAGSNYDTLPAGLLNYMVNNDDANLDHAAKAIWEYPYNNISDMLRYDKTKENSYARRPIWWVMQGYAEMSGTKVEVEYENHDKAICAIASKDMEKGEATIMTGNDGEAKNAVVELSEIPFEQSSVYVYELTDTENEGYALRETIPVSGETAEIPLEYDEQGVYKLVVREEESVPGGFLLKSPDDGFNAAVQPEFSWIESRGAESYELTVSKSKDMSNPVLHKTGITGTSYTAEEALEKGERYYWTVTAHNQNGSTPAVYDMYYSFVVTEDTQTPGPFSQLIPITGATGIGRAPKFVWTKAYGAESYTLEISEDAEFAACESYEVAASEEYENIYDKAFGSELGMELKEDTKYYWRVYAKNSHGERIMNGPVFSFTTGVDEVVKDFTLTEPSSGAENVDKRTTLRWEDANGAQFYKLEISESEDMTNPVVVRPNIRTNAYTLDEQDELESGKTYYWRVTAEGRSLEEPDTSVGTGAYSQFAGLVDDRDKAIIYGNETSDSGWFPNVFGQQYAGTNYVTERDGDYIEYTFHGNSIYWLTSKAANRGKAEIWLDGELVDTIDLFSEQDSFVEVPFSRIDLADGEHTIKIVNRHNGEGRIYLTHDAFFTHMVEPVSNDPVYKQSEVRQFTTSAAPYSPIVKFLYTDMESEETFVSFMPVADGVSYNIYAGAEKGQGALVQEGVTDSFVSLGKLENPCWITVKAVNAAGVESASWNEKYFDPSEIPEKLPAPSDLQAKTDGLDQVLSWSGVENAKAYTVRWKAQGSESWQSMTTEGTELRLSGLSDGVTYEICVAAVDKEGYSGAFSENITVEGTDCMVTVEAEDAERSGSLSETEENMSPKGVYGWKTAGDSLRFEVKGNKSTSVRYQNDGKEKEDFQLSLWADGEEIQKLLLPHTGGNYAYITVNLPEDAEIVELRADESQAENNTQWEADLVVDRITLCGYRNIGFDGEVTACANEETKDHIKDGIAIGFPATQLPDYEWHSYPGEHENGEWIEYRFSEPMDIEKVRVLPRTGESIAKAVLEFSNGDKVDIGAQSGVADKYINVHESQVEWVRLTAEGAAWPYICIMEFEVYGEESFVDSNKTLLQKTYDYALTLSTEGVTDSAKAYFEKVLEEAKIVLDNPKATQEEVDAAWDNLLTGIWGLGLVQGDKTMLEQLIVKAEAMIPEQDKYIQDNWQQLVDALIVAKDVYNDGDAMEEDVQPAAEALLNAILAQRFKADKSILEDLVNKAEGMDLSVYTAESVAVFAAAFENAKVVLADETLSEDNQAVVDKAVKDLSDAIENLSVKEDTSSSDNNQEDTSKEDENSTDKGNENESPATGDNENMIFWMGVTLISTFGLLMLLRKKHKA